MKHLITTLVAVLAFCGPALAQPPGHGQGASKRQGIGSPAPQSTAEHAKQAAEHVANEAVDAAMDSAVQELTGSPAPGTMPPGLSKGEKLPPGLEKQGKTPPGWSQGQKTGWGKTPGASTNPEGLIHRFVKGLFGQGKPDEAKPKPKPTDQP